MANALHILAAHAKLLAARRSPRWRAVEVEKLREVPACEACGSRLKLNVHHVLPFHLFPALELEQTNLIVLCRRCHLGLGHGDSWAAYNPNVRVHAARLSSTPASDRQATVVVLFALARRDRLFLPPAAA